MRAKSRKTKRSTAKKARRTPVASPTVALAPEQIEKARRLEAAFFSGIVRHEFDLEKSEGRAILHAVLDATGGHGLAWERIATA